MKNIAITILSGIVLVFFCSQEQDHIGAIKAKYQQINQGIKTFTKKKIEDNDQSADGANVVGFYNGSQLQLIVSEFFGEGGKGKMEYYFDGGKLIFVIYKDYIYNRPYYWDKKMAAENHDSVWYDSKKTKVEMTRFYFNNNELLKRINDGNVEVPVNSTESSKYKSDILEDVQRLQKLLE